MDIQSFLIGLQTGKNAGGGSSADVRYVTFMSYDGLTEVGKLPVAAGYDCPNPKFTATRESDAQYTYTQDGWSTTANGALDSNALKAVNEDRTLYAHFKATVRKYTITYLDTDGSVLKTETLSYGATPDYTPQKDGFVFDTWEPAFATVTGNASYTAKWTENITFAGGTWADIIRIAEAGEAQKYFKVGDERDFEYTISALPITSNDTWQQITYSTKLRIVGFDFDDLADDSGKASISIMSTTGFRSKHALANDGVQYFWESSLIRSKLSDALNDFPVDLKNGIKSVKKVTRKYVDGTDTTGEEITNDKLWVPSLGEFYPSLNLSNFGIKGEDIAAKYPSASWSVICPDDEYIGLRSCSYKGAWQLVYYRRGLSSYRTYMKHEAQIFPFGFCI